MRKDPFGFAVAIALCTATVTAITDAKAADGRGRRWWAGYHYCGGWAYQYGYAPHSCYIFGGG